MQQAQKIISLYNGQAMELSVTHTKESVLFALGLGDPDVFER